MDGWIDGKSCPLPPAPGGAVSSISAGAFPAGFSILLFSHSVLAWFEIQKALLLCYLSLLTSTHTQTLKLLPHT